MSVEEEERLKYCVKSEEETGSIIITDDVSILSDKYINNSHH